MRILSKQTLLEAEADFKWRKKKASAELRDRMGLEAIGSVLKRNRLRWFGHVERKDKEDWNG